MDAAGWTTAAATVAGVGLTAGGMLLQAAFASRDEKIAAQKATQSVLFTKLDVLDAAFSAHKLHVAEHYANTAALKELLEPIVRRLETIEKELRDERRQTA